jgi:hypothetical protein
MPEARGNLTTMADERQDEARADRDRERSTEAHWRAAEAEAEPDEPTQKTRKGLEIPVPKRKDVFDVFERAAKPLRSKRRSSPPKQ